MNIDKLEWLLDWDKNCLISGESDVKYLLGDAYIKWVEILIRDRVVKILADLLIMDTVAAATDKKYEIFDSRNKDVMKWVFGWIRELSVDSEVTTLAKQKLLIWYWVETVLAENSILTNFRLLKNEKEVEILDQSQRINIEAFERVKSLIKIGMTEEEISRLIKIKHLELWASGESFEPIVAFTENGANPHHISWRIKKLTWEDQILIDMWCVYRWYCSDMTRVVFMPNVPKEQLELYELVMDTTYKCLEYGKIEMTYREMYDKTKELLWENSELFIHSLSHWIWIDVHEIPLWSSGFDMKIEEWSVFSIEPWIYFPGKYGFRYEIVALATKDWLVELGV